MLTDPFATLQHIATRFLVLSPYARAGETNRIIRCNALHLLQVIQPHLLSAFGSGSGLSLVKAQTSSLLSEDLASSSISRRAVSSRLAPMTPDNVSILRQLLSSRRIRAGVVSKCSSHCASFRKVTAQHCTPYQSSDQAHSNHVRPARAYSSSIWRNVATQIFSYSEKISSGLNEHNSLRAMVPL